MRALELVGVAVHMEHMFDRENRFDDLRNQGYDAVLVTTGVSESKALQVENADAGGIYPGLEFLRQAKSLQKPSLTGEVVVIGGGNVAVDAAMTAVRLGADTVHLVCLESREEMPAHDWEIVQAEDEGVKIHPGWGPSRFTEVDGRVSGVDFKKCMAVFDERGRFDPRYDESETMQLSAGSVIVTIGQQVDAEFLAGVSGIATGPGGTLKVDEK